MEVDPSATTVEPEGLGLVLLAITLFFAAPTAVVVLLRSWIRARQRVFGTDDGLMLVGWILFICAIGVASRGTYAGIGAVDDRLNSTMQIEGRMYVWLFQMFYCSCLVFIKASICVTLLRIAVEKVHRVIVWITLAASCISTLIVIIGLLAMCRPIRADWDHSAGVCSPPVVITSLSYLVSAAAVATNWVCAILPGFMLYKAKMKRATKISISVILGLGILASVATIARLPYIAFYAQPKNYLHNVGNIVLWSVFESGTAIIAGSLPSLRRLVKNWISFDSNNEGSPAQITPYNGPSRGTVTNMVGPTSGSRGRHKTMVSDVAADGDWEPLDDASSSHKIYVKVDMEMQSLDRPPTSSRSDRSTEELGLPA
ncbi:hypothetical protein FDECE_11000 [Fusarium decemcellulare]|nr:hypothetical protein FDECE_11000 [Fusarium decemcellulare]